MRRLRRNSGRYRLRQWRQGDQRLEPPSLPTSPVRSCAEKLCAAIACLNSRDLVRRIPALRARKRLLASAANCDAMWRWSEFFGTTTQSCSQAAGITTSRRAPFNGCDSLCIGYHAQDMAAVMGRIVAGFFIEKLGETLPPKMPSLAAVGLHTISPQSQLSIMY